MQSLVGTVKVRFCRVTGSHYGWVSQAGGVVDGEGESGVKLTTETTGLVGWMDELTGKYCFYKTCVTPGTSAINDLVSQ